MFQKKLKELDAADLKKIINECVDLIIEKTAGTSSTTMEGIKNDKMYGLIKTAEKSNFILSAMQIEDLKMFMEVYSMEEITMAFKKADNAGVRNMNYVRGILERQRIKSVDKDVNKADRYNNDFFNN